MAARTGTRTRHYVPLVYRVAGLNACLLVAAVVVTLVVLSPRRLSSVAVDEAIVLVLSLALVALVNLMMLGRVLGPIAALTALTRQVDLTRPGMRMPDSASHSEAGELSLTFNQMLDRLEAERRDATGRVLAGQEAERLRIAQELHDQVGQELTAVLLGLARVQASAPPENRELIMEVQEAVRSSLEDVRRIAVELRPEALDELGLVSALAVLCERLSERTGMIVEQTVEVELPELAPDVELVIYRVAQEALTNVVRHSGTLHARLTLGRDDRGLSVRVIDDGRGLAAGTSPGTGMRGMRERAALIGGRLEVSAGPEGRGCEVRLYVDSVRAAVSGGSVPLRGNPAEDPDPAG
jgi:two-component system sensor histidine kinase UhpB